MKEYLYKGPLSGVSLKGVGDVMLHPGAVVNLPEDHDYTRRLIKRGWLTVFSAPAGHEPPQPPLSGGLKEGALSGGLEEEGKISTPMKKEKK
jgi:hypothetical protein